MRSQKFFRLMSTICIAVASSGSLNVCAQEQEHPFTPEQIAQAGADAAAAIQNRVAAGQQMSEPAEAVEQVDLLVGGAAGVNQSQFGDCWFESAVAAYARLPRGRRVLANMITQTDDNTYFVKFPDVPSQSFQVTLQNLADDKIRDFALWAQILDEALVQRFPNERIGPTKSIEAKIPNAVQGLSILSGQTANFVWTEEVSPNKIADIVQNCLNHGVPMVAGSRRQASNDLQLVVPGHSYTVIDFDSLSGMIDLRNPYGNNTSARSLQKYPNLPRAGEAHGGVQALGAGLVRMTVADFRRNYRCLAWGPISSVSEFQSASPVTAASEFQGASPVTAASEFQSASPVSAVSEFQSAKPISARVVPDP